MTAAMTFPPEDRLAVTTTAPTHTIRAQEQKVTVCNVPIPTPFTNASPLLAQYCLLMHSENDFVALASPTKANTVFI